MRSFSIGLCAVALSCTVQFQGSAAHAATETVLYSFGGGLTDGYFPEARLLNVDGTLYGATEFGGPNATGALFSVDAKTGAETVLHFFGGSGGDGATPVSGVVRVGKKKVYGTTEYGGDNGDGAVYLFNLKKGATRLIYSFCGQQNCTDGNGPLADLIDVKGALYGTTSSGGIIVNGNYGGTIFSIDPKTRAESVIYSFCANYVHSECADGAVPLGALINVNGVLYGTTSAGGLGAGTVYSIDPNTGAEKVLYSFCSQRNCVDGGRPEGRLLNVNGILYGTTAWGGTGTCYAYGCGTVFSFDPATGAETVLHSFQSADGMGVDPSCGLIKVNGLLYGTTYYNEDGGGGFGTVFSVDPSTGAEAVVHSFGGYPDGGNPSADLINVRGTLYGTTYVGGTNGGGTVFKIQP